MFDSERYKLHFGPYRMPRCRVGGRLVCQVRGKVAVHALSNGRIQWPLTKAGGHLVLVVCGGLAKAVRRESALAIRHWWGASAWAVWQWRKALGVPATTESTSRLRREYALEPAITAAQLKAQAQCRDPERDRGRRAKITAAKRGKPRPAHVLEALHNANRGRHPSAEARRKMSEAHKRRGTRPPSAGPAWAPHEEALLGRMPDEEVARRTGRTLVAVQNRRYLLRIEMFGRRGRGLAARGGRGRSERPCRWPRLQDRSAATTFRTSARPTRGTMSE